MHRLIISIIVLIFSLSACRQTASQGQLSKADMANLLTDIHLVDGYMNTLPIDSSRKVVSGLYTELFKKYNTDSATFKKSLEFYSKDTKEYAEIYTKVEANLNDINAKYAKLDQLKIDSVRHLDSISSDSLARVKFLENKALKIKDLLFHVAKDSTKVTFSTLYDDFLGSIYMYGPAATYTHNKNQITPPQTVVSEVLPADTLKQEGTTTLDQVHRPGINPKQRLIQ